MFFSQNFQSSNVFTLGPDPNLPWYVTGAEAYGALTFFRFRSTVQWLFSSKHFTVHWHFFAFSSTVQWLFSSKHFTVHGLFVSVPQKSICPVISVFLPKFMKISKLLILHTDLWYENLKMAWKQWKGSETEFFLLPKNWICFSKAGF